MRLHVIACAVALPLASSVSAAEPPGAPRGDAAIVPAGAALEELWNEGEFTEGVAVAPNGTIYFSDISMSAAPGRILKFDPATRQTSVHCADSGKSNGLMFDRTGKLIAACGANHGKQALCEIAADGSVKVLVDRFEGKRFNSPNDVVIHPGGGIYFSDPRYVGPEPVELDHQSVYRYDRRDNSLVRATTDVSKPNGVVISPDGKTLYVAETDNKSLSVDQKPPAGTRFRMTLNAFPINADGSLGTKRVLVDFDQNLGIDGMTVDVDGNIYAAVRNANRFGIVAFSPEGKERAYIPTPDLPTNCCFGSGEEASTLYVTAGKGLYRIGLKVAGYNPATGE
jgi:gluconolactonase